MSKTLRNQLYNYLQTTEGVVASGELQRMEWPKYAYGMKRGLHTPRSVVRRLEELAEDKLINVEYISGHAWYGINKERAPKKQIVEYTSEGTVRVKYV